MSVCRRQPANDDIYPHLHYCRGKHNRMGINCVSLNKMMFVSIQKYKKIDIHINKKIDTHK